MSSALTRWRKQRIVAGLLCMLAGLGTMVVAAGWLGSQTGPDVSTAAWIGSFGVVLIVVGGWLCRLGFAGPFPARFGEDATP